MSLVNDALKRASESSRSRPAAKLSFAPPEAGPVRRKRSAPLAAVIILGAISSLVVLCVVALTTDWIGPAPTQAVGPVAETNKPVEIIPDLPKRSATPTPAPAPAMSTPVKTVAPDPMPVTITEPVSPPAPAPVQPQVTEPQPVVVQAEPKPQPQVEPKPTFDTYTVQSGDTLSSIAERFYGKATAWRKLHELNSDRIANPNRLVVGMTLRVPAK